MKTQKTLSIAFAVIILWQSSSFSMQTKVAIPQTGWLPLFAAALCSLGQPTEDQRRQEEILKCRERLISHIREHQESEALRYIKPGVINEAILLEAAKVGFVPLLKIIIDCSGDTPWMHKALVIATAANHAPAVEVIIDQLGNEKPGDLDYFSGLRHYKTALRTAAKNGSHDVARNIIDGISYRFGKDWKQIMHESNEHNITVLYDALQGRHFEMVRLLLEKGADYFIQDNPGGLHSLQQVLARARELGANKIACLILAHHNKMKLPEMLARLRKSEKDEQDEQKERLKLKITGSLKLLPSLFIQNNGNMLLLKTVEVGDLDTFLFILSLDHRQFLDKQVILTAILKEIHRIQSGILGRLSQAFKENNHGTIETLKKVLQNSPSGLILYLFIHQNSVEKEKISKLY